MNLGGRFVNKWLILFRRNRFRDELEEEMAFHRAQMEQDLAAHGMTPEAARRAARVRFGNATSLNETSHAVVRFRMETVVQEPFCLRCRHSDADTAALAVVRVGGVEGAEPSAARVDEEDCPTEGAAGNERERVAVCPARAAISERVVGR